MLKKTTLAIALAAIFTGGAVQAATVYEADNGDKVDIYGEVGVGGHFGADYDSGEFYEDRNFIDDSFATIGVKGNKEDVYYRIELDYERENWAGGTGDMELAIDKLFIGYKLTKDHAIEVGLTDTAFDDYDKYGDLTFDTTVETGEAGDQSRTVKYEGRISNIRLGTSYSYESESSSGAKLGDIVNGYVGYFGDIVSVVVGGEKRAGSDGESKYGEQMLVGLGVRINPMENLTLGLNGFLEREDISNTPKSYSVPAPDGTKKENTVYQDYQEQENKGALISASYKLSEQWEVTGSYNFEEYEKWAIKNNDSSNSNDYEWGDDRTWSTVGVNFKPSRSVVFAIEGNFGEAAQDAYAYARVYF